MSYKDKNWLYDQYIIKKNSTVEIAHLCNVNSPTTVFNWLVRFNIKIRNLSESQKIKYLKGKIPWNKGLKGFLGREKHYLWKGNNAGQKAIHIWLNTNYSKPIYCMKCRKERKIELSFDHSKGNYTRNIEDYEWLCHSCHTKKDWDLGICNNQYTIKKLI